MPMYYPDLKSVERLAVQMADQRDPGRKYKGIIPKTEAELPEARIALGKYMREVWNDTVFAYEIEEAATEENYHKAISTGMRKSGIL